MIFSEITISVIIREKTHKNTHEIDKHIYTVLCTLLGGEKGKNRKKIR